MAKADRRDEGGDMSERTIRRAHDRSNARPTRPDMAQGDKAMKCYKDFREFLTVLDQQGQLLRIKDEVKFEPDLVSAGCRLGANWRYRASHSVRQDCRMHRRAGRDECPWLLAQSCVGARHGQGSFAERAVLRVRPSLQAVSRRARARHHGALARSRGRQGHQSVRSLAAVSSEPRRWRVLHRQGLHHLSRPGRLGQ